MCCHVQFVGIHQGHLQDVGTFPFGCTVVGFHCIGGFRQQLKCLVVRVAGTQHSCRVTVLLIAAVCIK